MRWEDDDPYRVVELVASADGALDLVSPWGGSSSPGPS